MSIYSALHTTSFDGIISNGETDHKEIISAAERTEGKELTLTESLSEASAGKKKSIKRFKVRPMSTGELINRRRMKSMYQKGVDRNGEITAH